MNDEIRVVKRCPHCGTRLFDKISLTTGFVEIKCPHCKHVVCINLALRRSRYRATGSMACAIVTKWPDTLNLGFSFNGRIPGPWCPAFFVFQALREAHSGSVFL